MKLTGYYMTAIAKTELGITDITVFERHSFQLNMMPGDAVDAVSLAGRLELPSCEVL